MKIFTVDLEKYGPGPFTHRVKVYYDEGGIICDIVSVQTGQDIVFCTLNKQDRDMILEHLVQNLQADKEDRDSIMDMSARMMAISDEMAREANDK